MLCVWLSSVWKISGVQIKTAGPLTGLPFSVLSAFPNSSKFCPLVECKYLHLTISAACCEHSIASVIVSDLGTSPWAGSHFGPVDWAPLPQVLHFCTLFFQTEQGWVRALTEGWKRLPSLDGLSFCWKWALHFPSHPCRAFHLMSLLLSPEGISTLSSLVHSGPPPHTHLRRLPVSILSAGT
jgi:hypothetical protein